MGKAAATAWPAARAGRAKPKEAANAGQPRLAWGSSEHLPPGSRGAREEGTWLSLLPGGQGRIWHLGRDEAGVVLKAPAVQALARFRRSASLAPRTGNGSVRFSGSGKYVGLILEVASVVVPVTKAGARGGALSCCQGEIPRQCEQDSLLG